MYTCVHECDHCLFPSSFLFTEFCSVCVHSKSVYVCDWRSRAHRQVFSQYCIVFCLKYYLFFFCFSSPLLPLVLFSLASDEVYVEWESFICNKRNAQSFSWPVILVWFVVSSPCAIFISIACILPSSCPINNYLVNLFDYLK